MSDYPSLEVGPGFLVMGGPDFKKEKGASSNFKKIKTKVKSLIGSFLLLSACFSWMSKDRFGGLKSLSSSPFFL